MDDLKELTFQCRSGDWYTFLIYPLKTVFPPSSGIYILTTKDPGNEYELNNFKFLHVGIANDLVNLNDLSNYHKNTTHVLISLRERGVDMVMEWKDIQNSFKFTS